MKTLNEDNGFTLIEVVIALGVLAFGILSLMLLQLSSIKGNSTANTVTGESTLAADRIETILELDYIHADLSDTDLDGTNRDNNEDGIDDSGNNFGLDDIGTSSAAGCTAAPADNCIRKGNFDVFWNVAVDQVVPDTKTIKIIVVPTQGRENKVEFVYIKPDVI